MDAEEPAIEDVAEVAGGAIVLPFVADTCGNFGTIACEGDIDLSDLGKDVEALGFELGVADECGADGFFGIDFTIRDIKVAFDVYGDGGWVGGVVIHTEEADELVLGDAEIVAGLDEGWDGVGKGDFGLEHVEAWDDTCFVAIDLVLELALEESNGLLLGGDEGAIEDNLVEIGFYSSDGFVDGFAEEEVGGFFLEFGGLGSGVRGAAVEEELIQRELEGPETVLRWGDAWADGGPCKGLLYNGVGWSSDEVG